MRKLLFTLLLTVCGLCYNLYAQEAQHIVILWDVTGSLLPAKPEKDLDGSTLPTYEVGNGMWVDLKKAIIECIDYAEQDPSNEITIVTFNDNIRDVFTRRITEVGKVDLVNFVKNYKYRSHSYTNVVDPLNKFYQLLEGSDRINYMFLFTDGENDDPRTSSLFIPTLDSWCTKTRLCEAFGFYVLVHPNAVTSEIRQSIQTQDNFWIVPDAKVRIKICSLPSLIKYNVRDEKGPKTICMSGRYLGAEGDVDLVSNDPYYEVLCSERDIKDGKLNIEVKLKEDVSAPINHRMVLTPKITNSDSYTFVGPNKINLEVSNLPERSLNLSLDNSNFGDASYYKSFLWIPEKSTSVASKIKVDFSEQAKMEGSSANVKVYLVDRKDGTKISPSSEGLDLKINGKSSESTIITPDMSEITIEILGGRDTKDAMYYGRIHLEPSRLDNYSINREECDFKWKFDFDQKINPLKLALIIILLLLVTAILFWMTILKPVFYPCFGSALKTFNIPGMAPLIIKFKGSRAVVVSAIPLKKQSGWNRFWTGKVVNKVHPAFQTSITFVPGRGKKILIKTQSGTYRVDPNPMPSIGSAVITDIKNNRKISVN